MGKERSAGSPANGPRAFRAAVLALLLGVVGLASVGFAGDPSTSVTPMEDAWFGVPDPHVGDRGLYEVETEPADTAPADEHAHGHHGDHAAPDDRSVTFGWAEPSEIYDRTGAHHHTNRLVVDEQVEKTIGSGERVYHLDQATGAVVGLTYGKRTSAVVTEDAFTGPVTHSWSYNWTTVFDPLGADDHQVFAPCGSLNPLQGEQRNLSMPVSFARACAPYAAWGVEAAPGSYLLDRFEESDGQRVAVLILDEASSAATGQAERPAIVEYRFRADLPYPILMVANLSGVTTTATLVGFERGDGPLGSAASSESPMPPIELAVPPAWGIDDADVAHPYPLGVAWQDALLDPRIGLQGFLDDHPGAYTTYAYHERIIRDGATEHFWFIVVTDGEASQTFCPGRTIGSGGAPSVPGTGVTWTTMCPQIGFRGPEGYEPGPKPTARSMQHAWKHLAPLTGLDPSSWSYGFSVQGDPEYLAESSWIATDTDEAPTSEVLLAELTQEPQTAHGVQVRFTSDGRLEGYATETETRSHGALEKGLPAKGAHQPASLDGSTRVLGALFAATPGEVGAVGGIAVGAAMLYWVWPWLNQGFIAPLFSRIQKPKVLDNERRQRIAAAVSAEPGVHFEELQRRTRLARGALQHHLQMLVQNDVIGIRQTKGYTCYYPKGEVDVQTVDAQAVARSPAAQRILEAWQAAPEASGAEIAERLGMSRQSVHYHVKRLKAAGLAP